jgi:hypothetical protein
MASHGPFGHLQPKLWAKEKLGVKLPIWLPTTKSLESTFSQCHLKECDTALKSSRRELQFWFGPRPDPSLGRGAMSVQSLGTPTRDSFKTPTLESQEKEPFRCSLRGETQRILYGGRSFRTVSAFPKASRSGFDYNTTNTIKFHTLYLAIDLETQDMFARPWSHS